MTGPTPKALESARALEQSGRVAEAVAAFREAGAVEESARLVRKLEAQGKLDAALEAWVRLRRHGEAARVARALGRLADAARLHAEAGQGVEAAWCHRQLGDAAGALGALLRVPPSEPRYRAAALEAIALSVELRVAGPQLEQFLAEFLRTGPLSDAELSPFDKLARLFLAHDRHAAARSALQRLAARAPAYQDAKERLAALDRDLRERDSAALKARRSEPIAIDLDEPSPPALDADLLLGAAPQPFEELEPLDEAPEELADAAALRELAGEEGLQELEPEPSAPPPFLAHPSKDELVPGPHLLEPALSAVRRPTPLPPVLPLHRPAPVLAPAGPLPRQRAGDLFFPGAVVASRYRLEEQIGQGGMAAVFRATDLELEEQVALKVFSLTEVSEVALHRFRQELKLSRQISHPNIIRLHDIGLHDGHRYISMELLTGRSLKERLLEPIGFVEALKLLEQACAGLQAAHDQGVVHRDVKPDNFFLTAESVLKVMDFGIAKQQAAPGVTVAGSIAGTPAYMSPEQISNFSAVGPATDLYALGVVAYEIFTGNVPFLNEELVPLLLQQVNQAPPPPREKNPGIPEELERVILRLLEKDPARRHASARELAEELKVIRESYGG